MCIIRLLVIFRFILNQKVQIPVLPYFGACGRLTFVQGPYKPLMDFIKEPLALRVHLASQILQMIDGFMQDDTQWLLFTRDLNYHSFIVTDSNQVFLKDLSYLMLIDKELQNEEDYENPISKDTWSESKFDELYYDLVDSKTEECDEKCAKVFDYAGHMFSIVCRFVLSDDNDDQNYRRTNPAAKSYPGLYNKEWKISNMHSVEIAEILSYTFFAKIS